MYFFYMFFSVLRGCIPISSYFSNKTNISAKIRTIKFLMAIAEDHIQHFE